MKKQVIISYAIAVSLGAVPLLVAQAPAPAPAPGNAAPKAKGKAKGPATPSGPTPRLPDGTVDLTGVWAGGGSSSADITKG